MTREQTAAKRQMEVGAGLKLLAMFFSGNDFSCTNAT